MIDQEFAHLKVMPQGRFEADFPGLDERLEHVDSFMEEIASHPEVEGVTERLEIQGMLYLGTEEAFVNVTGFDLERDRSVFSLSDAIVHGVGLEDTENGVLLGLHLARELGIEVGDRVTIMVRSAPGALNPRQLLVKGLISSGMPEMDMYGAYVTMQTARQMALLNDAATEVAIRLKDKDDAARLKDVLSGQFPDFDWFTWRDLSADFLNLLKVRHAAQFIILGLFVLMAAVGIANTMIMSVHERTREIGALRALGFERGTVQRIFLFEGLLIGLTGVVLGIVLGGAFTLWLNKVGISMAAYEDTDMGFAITSRMYPAFTTGNLVLNVMFGMFMALVASWGSARRAARKEIVQALREG